MSKNQYNPEIHHRRSIRLKGHDYAGGGTYFVTICAHHRQQLFGRMAGGKVELTEAGHVVQKCWQAIPEHFPGVTAKELAVMPDHVHGLVVVGAKNLSPVHGAKNLSPVHGAKDLSPIQPPVQGRTKGTSRTLGSVVRGFKVGVTKWVRENTEVQDVWHRNYYEMIVWDAGEEHRIANYIRMNPWRCVMDFGNGLRGMGNPTLWNAEKLGVLCSRNAPRPKSIPKVAAYLSGFHSPMEQEILQKLLQYKQPLIWCPAWGLSGTLSPETTTALEENRMLILEMAAHDGNLASAAARNRFVLKHADKLWLPHVTPGGMLDRLVREAQVQGKFLNRVKISEF
ncbi:MAG: transposase [Kiritimatiellia bacterium]